MSYRGLNVADVLAMSVEEAVGFFAEESSVRRSLEILAGAGLGYLCLGQPATELSGGEAQRIKLATELQRRRVVATADHVIGLGPGQAGRAPT